MFLIRTFIVSVLQERASPGGILEHYGVPKSFIKIDRPNTTEITSERSTLNFFPRFDVTAFA